MLVTIQNEINLIKPRIIENINSQRQALEVERASYNAESKNSASLLSTVPQKERQLVDVSRQQNIKNSTYNFLLEQREKATFSLNSAVADSRIVDKASTSPDPVSPKRPLIMFLFPIAGLGLGVGLINLRRGLNGKIMFRSEIEKVTDFPIIGELTYDNSKNPLVMAATGRSFIMEQFRQLRVAVALGYLGQPAERKQDTGNLFS